MKTSIQVLNRLARVRMPNSVVKDQTLKTLSPLAVKLLMVVAHRWYQRQWDARSVPPSRRGTDHLTFRVRWQELKAQITRPGSTSSFSDRDYRHLRNAFDELFALAARRERSMSGKPGYCALRLVTAVSYEADPRELTYRVEPEFEKALQIMAEKGFALVPLADAFALFETRHLQMLMLAVMVLRMYIPDKRTFEVAWLREFFGLQGASYDDWRQLFRKLKAAAEAVSSKTDYRVTLHPQTNTQDGRRVGAVRFDVRLRHESLALPDDSSGEAKMVKPVISWIAARRLLHARIERDDAAAVVKPRIRHRAPEPPPPPPPRRSLHQWLKEVAEREAPTRKAPQTYVLGECYED